MFDMFNMSRVTSLSPCHIRLRGHFDSATFGFDGLYRTLMLFRHLVGYFDDDTVSRVAVEVVVKIFKSPIGSLWVEEVHHRYEDQIQHSEDDVKPIAEVSYSDGCELSANETEELMISVSNAKSFARS